MTRKEFDRWRGVAARNDSTAETFREGLRECVAVIEAMICERSNLISAVYSFRRGMESDAYDFSGLLRRHAAPPAELLPKPTAKPPPRIIRNRARCKRCGDIIESRGVHDFVVCSCWEGTKSNGGIAVDGGLEYCKRLGDVDNFEELSEVEEVSNAT